ncbi:DEAD/DEAH box helicase family protein [Streptomyces lavendulae]
MLHDLPVERLPSELWARQRAAADCVLNAFAMGSERQQVIMPCGTGKTHLAVHIAHELTLASRSLTVLPTLQLLNQTARVWYTSGRPGRYLGVCSDAQTSEPVLNGVLTMISDPAHLAAAVRTADGPVSVFATYASLPKLAEAHRRRLLPRWDIAVVEEAHRTAEGVITPDNPHAEIHYDDGILARTCLCVTATPPIPCALPAPGDRQTLVIWDVDLPAHPACGTYNPTVQRPEPVETGLLTPYQLLRIQVPERLALPRGRAQGVGEGTAGWAGSG